MHPTEDYHHASSGNQPRRSMTGFSLGVIIILLFIGLIIGGLVQSFHNTTYAANTRLVYMAAQAKATEFKAAGNYHVPIQADLISLIGDEVNQDAVISVIDENQDAAIDAIIYIRDGLATQYAPGEMTVTHSK